MREERLRLSRTQILLFNLNVIYNCLAVKGLSTRLGLRYFFFRFLSHSLSTWRKVEELKSSGNEVRNLVF